MRAVPKEDRAAVLLTPIQKVGQGGRLSAAVGLLRPYRAKTVLLDEEQCYQMHLNFGTCFCYQSQETGSRF